MTGKILTVRIVAFVLPIAFSLAIGCLIPWFYEWTDSDQSRPSPLLWQVPAGIAAGSLLFCCAFSWLPRIPSLSCEKTHSDLRFNLRSLLIVTTCIAICIPLGLKSPLVVCGCICIAAFSYFIAFAARNASSRLPSLALLACMLLPYSWVITYDEFGRILPAIPVLLGSFPTLVPGAILAYLSGQPFQEAQWLTYLLTAAELIIGVRLIRLGPKPTIAYLLVVMQISLLGSLAFLQLCLA
jgi:hypothetical protein